MADISPNCGRSKFLLFLPPRLIRQTYVVFTWVIDEAWAPGYSIPLCQSTLNANIHDTFMPLSGVRKLSITVPAFFGCRSLERLGVKHKVSASRNGRGSTSRSTVDCLACCTLSPKKATNLLKSIPDAHKGPQQYRILTHKERNRAWSWRESLT
ncbi:hypothetical protein C7212DRAFT_342431 [Tuber magnatum]|uniref:Uncharacterized protein n=1 Tax=Tuber magnatum TaxID=42249 RepID=A0A317SXW1_9PEZI|nr:hypothetical protein C7212DRAFT_342431 [Tuber magnatum]